MIVLQTKVPAEFVDLLGHMNHARYLDLFEFGRWEALLKHNFGPDRIKAVGISPVVLEINVKYHRELKLNDEVAITFKSGNANRKVFIIHQEMIRLKDQVVAATAEVTAGVMDLKARKLLVLNEEWNNILKSYND